MCGIERREKNEQRRKFSRGLGAGNGIIKRGTLGIVSVS